MIFKNREQLINNGQTSEIKHKREDVLEILNAAVHAVDPYISVKNRIKESKIVCEDKTIDPTCFDTIYLIGFGKASAGMAQAICDNITIHSGVVITNDSKAIINHKNIEVIIGSHPLPDNKSIQGAEKALEIALKCTERDLLIVLISGGGSAVLCKPRVNLVDLQDTTDLLLRSGATINEINTIRKHLSHVKGGQLVKYTKATVVSLVISDIVYDPLEFIASGPTYPDSTTFTDAFQILRRYHIWKKIPHSVQNVIKNGIKGEITETPKPDDQLFEKVNHCIIANNLLACIAAENQAKKLGYQTMLLTTSLTGEAREIGRYLIDKATSYQSLKNDWVFISGGETTVTVKGSGSGGRNQEMVLGVVEKIAESGIVFASLGTDGIDGGSDAAGAIADGFTFQRGKNKNLDPDEFLKNNNSYMFFKPLGDLFLTGPTGTNVMDIQILVV
ncbi:MAG: glycerate kinase [Thermoplasmatota archaeon]